MLNTEIQCPARKIVRNVDDFFNRKLSYFFNRFVCTLVINYNDLKIMIVLTKQSFETRCDPPFFVFGADNDGNFWTKKVITMKRIGLNIFVFKTSGYF